MGTTSFTVTATKGNGYGRAIFIKSGSAPTAPTDGTYYTANTVYASGTQCIYADSTSASPSVTVTGLTSGVTYFVQVFEFNGGAGGTSTIVPIYLTAGSASSQATSAPVTNPSAFGATAASASQINLTATANGNSNPIVVVANTTGSFTAPTNGVAPPSVNGSFAGGTLLYNGTAGSLTNHTSLTNNTIYYYEVFSYDNTSNYTYSTGATANATTLVGSVANTTIASISSIGATLSGTVTASGTAALTALGISYGTSASPSNANPSGTTTVGAFSQNLTGLSPQTLYYARAYATNAGGTVYAATDTSFRTLSTVPTTQAGSLLLVQTGASSITVSVASAAVYPATGASKTGYLLAYSTSGQPALVASPNGRAPASALSSGTLVTVTDGFAPTAPTINGTVISSGLSVGNTCNVLVVPYTWDGNNPSTYNYLTTTAPTASITLFAAQATWFSSVNNSQSPTIVGNIDNTVSVAPANGSSTYTLTYTAGNAVQVSDSSVAVAWRGSGGSATPNATFSGIVTSVATTPAARFLDFKVKPVAGNDLTVSSLAIPIRNGGSSTAMAYAIGYSLDGTNFTIISNTSNTVSTTGSIVTGTVATDLLLGNAGTSTTTYTAPISVPNGTTLTVRVILWRRNSGVSSNNPLFVGPLSISGSTAVSAPVITSSLTASATVNVPSSTYTITATNSPTSFAASNLPPGLNINTSNGQITGTPTQSGNYPVVISATNAGGTGTANLSYTIGETPAITSSLTAMGVVGSPMGTYTITASGTPTSYSATGLPSGLSVNTSTGEITGTPAAGSYGTYTVVLGATNASGTGTANLVLSVLDVPIANSISPATASVDTTAFTLTVTGNRFTSNSTVFWNGVAKSTNFISATSLTATIPSTDVASTLSSGTASVTVATTGVTGSSNAQTFTLTVPTPTVSNLLPGAALAGGAGFTLTVNGTNFLNGVSTIYWGATALATTYVSGTQLTATVPSGNIASVGTIAVRVTNAGAGLSVNASSVNFHVVSTSATWVSGTNSTPTIVGNLSSSITTAPTNLNYTVNYAGGSVNIGRTGATSFNGDGTTTTVNGASFSGVTYSGLVSGVTAGQTDNRYIDFKVAPATGYDLSVRSFTIPIKSGGASTNMTYAIGYSTDGTNFTKISGSVSGVATTFPASSITVANTNDVSISTANATSTTYFTPASAISVTSGSTLTLRVIGWRKINSNTSSNSINIGPLTVLGNATQLAPVITNATLTASGVVGQTITSYFITASNVPTTYDATNLPAGLAINNATGEISGTPTVAGTNTVVLSATNAAGTDTKNLSFTINSAPPPVINSALTFSGTVGTAVSTYTITATNTPTTFGATGLPSGLSINTSTGEITGTPASGTGGVYNVSISATNTGGTGTATLVVSIVDVPTTTSISPTSTPVAGNAFTITVNGTNFINGASAITWNGTALATTFVSATQLTAVVPSGNIASGVCSPSVSIKVSNTGIATASNGQNFAITMPTPTLTALSQYTVVAGSSGFVLTVTGTNFINGVSTIYWNGAAHSTVFVGASQLTASILTAEIASTGSFNVGVTNASACGSASSANMIFSIINARAVWFSNTNSSTAPSISGSISNSLTVAPTINLYNNNASSYVAGGTLSIWRDAVNTGGWPADGSVSSTDANYTGISTGAGGATTDARYVDFKVAPAAGYTLNLSNIALSLKNTGTSGAMWYSAAYSIGGSAFTKITTQGNTANVDSSVNTNDLKINTTNATAVTNFSPASTVTVANGSTLTLRVIAWRRNASNSTANNSINIGPVVLSGITAAIPATTITSPLTASASVNAVAGTYTITASNSPIAFSAGNLPPGLSLNAATGEITGTPTQSGSYPVVIGVDNGSSTDTKTLVYTINAPTTPAISGVLTASSTVGQSFSYQIVATNNPTSFNATGLPSGLSVNTVSGTITGTPAVSGSFTVLISATKSGQTGTSALALTVAPAAYFYYTGTGALDNFQNWKTAPNGAGVTAPDASVFATSGYTFEIRNNATTANNSGTWPTSGSISKIIVGNASIAGVKLTVANGKTIAATIDLPAAASGTNKLVLSDATLPTLGNMNVGSTVEYAAATAQTVTTATYGNLTISNTSVSGATTVAGSTVIVGNALVVANGAMLTLGNTSTTRVTVNGSTVVNGTLAFPASVTSFINGTGSFTANANAVLMIGSSNGIGTGAGSSSGNLRTTPAPTFSPLASFVMQGGAAQVTGTGFPATVRNLTINNAVSVTLSGAVAMTGLLSVNSGTLNTAGLLTLKSNSLDTSALVGKVTGTISGNVVVERFIPGGYRAYRDLAPAVFNAGSIFANWQENGSTATLGYGMFITGQTSDSTSAGVSANGIDKSPNGIKSAYIYTNGAWSPVSNTNTTNLSPYIGVRALVRGDRTFSLFTTPLNQTAPGVYLMNRYTKLKATGSLVTGTVEYSTTGVSAGSFTDNTYKLSTSSIGYSSVGNPYVAPLDWKNIVNSGRATGLSATYYYLDPTIGSSGAYVSYNASSGPSNGVDAIRYIQAGQAFWVENTTASPVLTITEDDKWVTATKTAVFGSDAAAKNKLVFKLAKHIGGAPKTMDAATVVFHESFQNGYGAEDARKLPNPSENISIWDAGNQLCIDGRKPAVNGDQLPLSLDQLSEGSYTLQIDGKAYTGTPALLVDNLSGTETPIGNGMEIAIEKQATTDLSRRFTVVFKSPIAAVAPEINTARASVSLYPNPVIGSKVNVGGLAEGSYQAVISTLIGNKSASIAFRANAGTTVLDLGKPLHAGQYIVDVHAAENGHKVASLKLTVGK